MLQARVDVDVLRLSKDKKNVTTNMISVLFGKELLGIKMSNGMLVSKVMTHIVNTDLKQQQSRCLTSFLLDMKI